MGCIFSGSRRSVIIALFVTAAAVALSLAGGDLQAGKALRRLNASTRPWAERPRGGRSSSDRAWASVSDGHPYTPEGLVDLVRQVEIERVVRELSGADTIRLDGEPVVLKTRYAYSEQKHQAARYLLEEIDALGYEPDVQLFVLRKTRPDLTGIAVSRSADTVWTAGTDGIVYRSFLADGWERFEKCGDTKSEVFDLYVDPAGRLWAASGLTGGNLGTLAVSLDGGLTWLRRKSGISIYNIRGVAFSNDNYGIACGSFGTVIQTADGGVSWLAIDPSTFRYLGLNGVAASEPLRFWIVADGGYLFETRNLGAAWIEHKLDTYYPLNAISFADSLHGIIVGTGVAYYTVDGGESWIGTTVDQGTEPDLRCVAMFDTLRAVASGGAGRVFMSENGGADWTSIEAGCPEDDDIAGVAFVERDLFWTAGRDEAQLIDIAPPEAQCSYYEFGDTIWGKNIRFCLEGRDLLRGAPDHRIVMCAHYDATSGSPDVCAPGADDNASGVAGVLSSARALYGATVSRTIEFVLFDGEEPGLLGSRYFAGHFDAGVVYEAVINLDMLGYDMYRDWSFMIAGRDDPQDSSLSELVMMAIDTLGLPLQPEYTVAPNLGSDHMAFQDVGVPGILLIESGRMGLNPAYHSCRDVADTIMFDYLTECAKAALGSVAFLAGYEFYEGNGEEERPIALYQNYPNPFTSNTVVSFTAPEDHRVAVDVFDVLGRFITRLEPFRVAASDSGYADWDGRNRGGRPCASGVYFVRLRVGTREVVSKAVLVR